MSSAICKPAVTRSSPNGSRRISNFVFRSMVTSPGAMSRRRKVRQALEPWHVLGEEGGAGSTVRYVDSSLERLQVKVQGMIDSRHRVACNGHPVPLHPTGMEGEYVAGVRFRAWQPPEMPSTPPSASMPRLLSTSWIIGTSAPSAVAPITSVIPAA